MPYGRSALAAGHLQGVGWAWRLGVLGPRHAEGDDHAGEGVLHVFDPPQALGSHGCPTGLPR